MSDLSDTIKGFYSDFILRDLLSFVTPGAIVVFSIAFMLSESWEQLFKNLCIIPWFAWILFFGFFYLIGLSLQVVRELFPWLKFPPIVYRNKYRDTAMKLKRNTNGDSIPVDEKKEFTRQFVCDEHFRNSKWYAEFRLPFIRKTQPTKECSFEAERKIEERFIVIMQASGNAAIAFGITVVVGSIVLLINYSQKIDNFTLFLITLICIILSMILLENFQIHRQRLLDWELEVAHPHILSSRSFSRNHSRRRL